MERLAQLDSREGFSAQEEEAYLASVDRHLADLQAIEILAEEFRTKFFRIVRICGGETMLPVVWHIHPITKGLKERRFTLGTIEPAYPAMESLKEHCDAETEEERKRIRSR